MSSFNSDTVAVLALMLSIYTLFQLSRNWSSFWQSPLTRDNQQIAERLGIFVLLPIAVLMHEVGHALATIQVGGQVVEFQWRFYWGYVRPLGIFTPSERWWITFSGNLVSIVLSLLPIYFLPRIRRRIVAEILYSFVIASTVHSLIGYPMMGILGRVGDWVRIYDFSIQPYAGLTLILHVGILLFLWQLYHSQSALQWRLARQPSTIQQWEELNQQASTQPENLEPQIELVRFLSDHDEARIANQRLKQLQKRDPHNPDIQFLQVDLLTGGKPSSKQVSAAATLLRQDLSDSAKCRVYRNLSFTLYHLSRYSDALNAANQGLAIDPADTRLHCYRAAIYAALGEKAAAQTEMRTAMAQVETDTQKQAIEDWCTNCFKHH